jgi:hypothetical protein
MFDQVGADEAISTHHKNAFVLKIHLVGRKGRTKEFKQKITKSFCIF